MRNLKLAWAYLWRWWNTAATMEDWEGHGNGDVFDRKFITAEEAKDIGLINHTYETGELIKNALQLADRISLNPIEAIISTKKLIKDLVIISQTD